MIGLNTHFAAPSQPPSRPSAILRTGPPKEGQTSPDHARLLNCKQGQASSDRPVKVQLRKGTDLIRFLNSVWWISVNFLMKAC
jgi:hypothetical protein